MSIVDLSLPIRSGTLTPPSQGEKIKVTTAFRHPGFWQASWISMSCHTSSHVDSPLHVVQGAPTIGKFPIERFIGDAVVLDLKDCGRANYPIGVAELEKFEGDIKKGDIAILQTGWSDKMTGLEAYFTQSPYLTKEGAEWLVERRPKAVGFDFFQEYRARFTDFDPDDFTVHKILLSKDILLMEGFTNLKSLKNKRFVLYAVPIKITDAEAAPARYFAIED